MAIIALVPARAGSKGIPGKNIRPLCGEPLIAYTAEVIKQAGVFDRAILSTDSADIAAVGNTFGLETPFLRPKELARDDTPMIDVITHAMQWLKNNGTPAKLIVLLQPTQPLRQTVDVLRAIEILHASDCDSVVSVVAVPAHLSPDYVMRIDDDGKLVNFLADGVSVTRRQDVRQAYVRDGTVYAFRADTVYKHRSIYGPACLPLIVQAEHSINIDTQSDWEEAERRLGCR